MALWTASAMKLGAKCPMAFDHFDGAMAKLLGDSVQGTPPLPRSKRSCAAGNESPRPVVLGLISPP